MITCIVQGYVCKPEILNCYVMQDISQWQTKIKSNYSVTLVRNSNAPKSNDTVTSSIYIIVTKQGIS